MSDLEKVGFGSPPKATRWKKGQSGNPLGRPRSRTLVMDAALILNQPVDARSADGQTVSLDGIEAAYLALCRKGLKGHRASLLDAIRIMMEVSSTAETAEEESLATRERVLDALERMGVKVRREPNDAGKPED